MLGPALFHDELWQVVVALGVQGLGGGLLFAGLPSLVIESVPARQSGIANGMNFTIRMIGASVGTAVTTAIVTSTPGAAPACPRSRPTSPAASCSRL